MEYTQKPKCQGVLGFENLSDTFARTSFGLKIFIGGIVESKCCCFYEPDANNRTVIIVIR